MEELKQLSYKAIYDKKSKMSGRVMSALIYTGIRICEIIDWWFPLKTECTPK